MNLNQQRRLAVSVFFFVSGLCFATWASRIPAIKEKMALGEAGLGSLLLVLPVGALLGLPLAGWLVDRYGSRPAVVWSALAYALFLALLGQAPTLVFLVPAMLLFGLTGNLLNISVNTQALNLQKEYGKAIMASLHGLWSLAGFVGAGIGILLLYLGASTQLHLFLVFLCLVGLVLIFKKGLLRHDKTPKGGGSGFKFSKPDPFIVKLGVVGFCGMMCEGCMFDWSGVYFKEVVAARPEVVTAGYVSFMGMMAAARFVSDKTTDRFGAERVLQGSGLLISLGLLVSVLFPTFWPAIAGFLLVGAGTSSVVPLTYTAAGASTRLSTGVALAMVSTISFFGFLLGPPLIGFVAEVTSLRVSFALIAVVGLTITFLNLKSAKKNTQSVAGQ